MNRAQKITTAGLIAGLLATSPLLFAVDLDDAAVSQMQRELTALGYYGGEADGDLDDPTRLALARFQQDSGLPSTGEPNQETLNALARTTGNSPVSAPAAPATAAAPALPALDPLPAPKPASTPPAPVPYTDSRELNNDQIRYAQRQLGGLGYYQGEPDGRLNDQTNLAVARFQFDNDLVSTGVLDGPTLAALRSAPVAAESATASTQTQVAAASAPPSDDYTDVLNRRSADKPFVTQQPAPRPVAPQPAPRPVPVQQPPIQKPTVTAQQTNRPSPWLEPAPAPAPTYTPPAPATVPTQPVQTNADSNAVRYAQMRLRANGYGQVSPTGTMDTVTAEALRAFQTSAGLVATGQPDSNTMAALVRGGFTVADTAPPVATAAPVAPIQTAAATAQTYAAAPDGASTRYIERRLSALGHDPGPVDETFTDQTRFALSAFQNNSGLPGTGIPDAATMQALQQGAVTVPVYAGAPAPAPVQVAAPAPQQPIAPPIATSYAAPTPTNIAFDAPLSGTERDRMRYAQIRMLGNGYLSPADAGSVSSIRAAVAAYQTSVGLAATGNLDSNTMAALAGGNLGTPSTTLFAGTDYVAPPVMQPLGPIQYDNQTGVSGGNAYALEQRLAELGYNPGPIDGVETAETSAAIRAFQLDSGLPVSGEADRTTQDYLALTANRERPLDPFVITSEDDTFGDEIFVDDLAFISDSVTEDVVFELSPEGYLVPVNSNDSNDGELIISDSFIADESFFTLEGDTAPILLDEIGQPSEVNYPVKRLQRILSELRFYRGPIDGIFGENTTFALRAFQRQAGISNRGSVNAETARELALYEWMVDGNRSATSGGEFADLKADQKKRIEEALAALGYEPGRVDGKWDHLSNMALGLFQHENDLADRNGELDEDTLAVLTEQMRAQLNNGSAELAAQY